MSFFTESISNIGVVLIVSIIISKIKDSLIDKEVHLSILELITSKDVLSVSKAYLRVTEAILNTVLPRDELFKKIVITFNYSLINSLVKISESIVESDLKDKKSKTIIGLMLGEKLKKSSMSQIILLIVFLINLIISFFLESSVSSFVIAIVAIGLLAIHIDHKLIEYRIKSGWYGKNEFETIEMIDFILSHADKNDFNDQGGLKKIISIQDLSDKKTHVNSLNGVMV